LPAQQSVVALTIERCDSLAHGDEIKALFLRNDRPTFPAFFDRAYPYAVSAGGRSWVARDGRGAMVGHLAAFPRVFRDATRVARAALLVDNVFDAAHRNFWSAVELCRRALADLSATGDFDFAYTDPTPPGLALVRALRFTQVGTLHRFVLPLQPLYLGFFRIKARAEPLSVERVGGRDDARIAAALRALRPGARFRGERSLDLYATRLGGETIPNWQWLLLRAEREGGGGTAVAGLVLTARPPGAATVSVIDAVWDDARVSPASVLHAVARAARDDGCKKLSMFTLAESALARSLKACGFVRRADALPVVVHLSREGAELPPIRDWSMTYFDGSAW